MGRIIDVKKRMTLEDAIELAIKVDFLTEVWEKRMYAYSIYNAYLWGKSVK